MHANFQGRGCTGWFRAAGKSEPEQNGEGTRTAASTHRFLQNLARQFSTPCVPCRGSGGKGRGRGGGRAATGVYCCLETIS
eukprot:1143920-Pelagomonas_calceolata.AAC.2